MSNFIYFQLDKKLSFLLEWLGIFSD